MRAAVAAGAWLVVVCVALPALAQPPSGWCDTEDCDQHLPAAFAKCGGLLTLDDVLEARERHELFGYCVRHELGSGDRIEPDRLRALLQTAFEGEVGAGSLVADRFSEQLPLRADDAPLVPAFPTVLPRRCDLQGWLDTQAMQRPLGTLDRAAWTRLLTQCAAQPTSVREAGSSAPSADWVIVFGDAGDELLVASSLGAARVAPLPLSADGRTVWAFMLRRVPTVRWELRLHRGDDAHAGATLRPLVWRFEGRSDAMFAARPSRTCVRLQVDIDPSEQLRLFVDGEPSSLVGAEDHLEGIQYLPFEADSFDVPSMGLTHRVHLVRMPSSNDNVDPVLEGQMIGPGLLSRGGLCARIRLDVRRPTAARLYRVTADPACADAGADGSILHEAAREILAGIYDDQLEDAGAWSTMVAALSDFDETVPVGERAGEQVSHGRRDTRIALDESYAALRALGVTDVYQGGLYCVRNRGVEWEYAFVARRLHLEPGEQSRLSTAWTTGRGSFELRDLVTSTFLRVAERPYVRLYPIPSGSHHHRFAVRVEAFVPPGSVRPAATTAPPSPSASVPSASTDPNAQTAGASAPGLEYRIVLRRRLTALDSRECEDLEEYARLRRSSFPLMDTSTPPDRVIPLGVNPAQLVRRVERFWVEGAGIHRFDAQLELREAGRADDEGWVPVAIGTAQDTKRRIASSRCARRRAPQRRLLVQGFAGDRVSVSAAQAGRGVRTGALLDVPFDGAGYDRWSYDLGMAVGYSYAMRLTETLPSWEGLIPTTTTDGVRSVPATPVRWQRHSALAGISVGGGVHLGVGVTFEVRSWILGEVVFIDVSDVPRELVQFRGGSAEQDMIVRASLAGMTTMGFDFPVGDLLRLQLGAGLSLFFNGFDDDPPTAREGPNVEWLTYLGGSL